MVSSIKQVRFTLKNPVIIKYSLTVSKFPAYSHNPLITYDRNVSGNRKEFYAFKIFRYDLSPEILTLNIKSVNFNVNILTTLTGDVSGFHLSFSISVSIINSPSHSVNFSDVSGYKNISIQMKDLVIESGVFMFNNIRERCQPMEQIKNIIEMNNVTICNAENIALSVHGCFNVSIEKLTCSNITWMKRDLFTFTGGVMNAKNVLIRNVLANYTTKYNKSDLIPFFLIYKSVGEIQNVLIKDSVGTPSIRSGRLPAVLIVQNSVVKVLNMKMEGNSFLHFARADNSSIYIENMTLFENSFTATLFRVKESNVTLYEIKFYRNKIGSLLYINRNSKVFITNNSFTGNKIFKSAYLLLRSHMIMNNTNIHSNRMKNLIVAKSQSNIFIDNLTLTNNNGSIIGHLINHLYTRLFYYYYKTFIRFGQCTISIKSRICDLSGNSTIQLNNVAFIRNKLMGTFFWIKSNSSAVIQNNTLTENKVSSVSDIRESSTIRLNHVTFIRNNISRLLLISSNSRATIQNNTLTENKVSNTVYNIQESSTIQLNHVTLIRNKIQRLLFISSGFSAIIQNNTLTENNVSYTLYDIEGNSTIQLSHVTFTRNRLMEKLLKIHSYSRAIMQNNKLTDNNISLTLYYISGSCSVKLINNTMAGNSLERMLFAHSSYLGIDTIFIEKNTLSQLISVFECKVSLDSMKIRKNGITSRMIYVENSAGRIATTYIENYDNFMTSAFTTTCTYLGNKYFPFEIANTEIIWIHALPVSARPIVQLSGKVSLVNVKLLVTSLFDTEILRYSTKDVPLSVNGKLKVFSNIYTISSLFIGCTKAIVKHFAKAGSFRCLPCARGTYTLKNESLNTSLSFQSKNVILRENTSFTCLYSPVGANCTASIKSKSNYYGYKTEDQKLKFLPCLRGFCCTGSQCTTIKSCNKNRVGTLCERCIKSYVESFLSTDCVPIHSCQNFANFWLVYCIYALILTTFLYYMKDSITFIKTAGSNFGGIFKYCTKEKENDVETDTMIGIDGAEEQLEKTSHFITMSGIFALIVSFYQIRQLMSVDVKYKN